MSKKLKSDVHTSFVSFYRPRFTKEINRIEKQAHMFFGKSLFENRYLLSCQKEFVPNSGSTSVAFMIRATRTKLTI